MPTAEPRQGRNVSVISLAQKKSVQEAASLLPSLLKSLRIGRQHQQAGSLLYTSCAGEGARAASI